VADDNPYRPPQVVLEDEKNGQPISRAKRLIAVVLTLLSALCYIGIYVVVPRYKVLFEGFGEDLPNHTIFVLNNYIYSGGFYLISLIPCIALLVNRKIRKNNAQRLFAWVVMGTLVSILVFLFIWFSQTFAVPFIHIVVSKV